MQVTTFAKQLAGFEKDIFDEHLNLKLPRFEKFLTHFDSDSVKLNVTAEKFIHKDAYKVEMFLELPKASRKILYSSEDSRDLRKAIDFAKRKLIEQIKEAVERMQRQNLHAA
jgi:ribosomal subunit interface protein